MPKLCLPCHNVSGASSKTGVASALQHLALFICHKNSGGRYYQLCRSLGEVQCCSSSANGNENIELHFEEIANGKCRKNVEVFVLLFI